MKKRCNIGVAFIISIVILLGGCSTSKNSVSQDTSATTQSKGDVLLELTYPAGESPKVFTKGWVFGAKCIVNSGTVNEKDVSEQVQWSGMATYEKKSGAINHPVFNSVGINTITLTYDDNGSQTTKNFQIEAVSPENYAHVYNLAFCPADSHGCIGCPHSVKGPIMSGSPTVNIDGYPAARVGDGGFHSACCGPNTFVISTGDEQVLIEGKPAARIGDKTTHCGGIGTITSELDDSLVLKIEPGSLEGETGKEYTFQAILNSFSCGIISYEWLINGVQKQSSTETFSWDSTGSVEESAYYSSFTTSFKEEGLYTLTVLAKVGGQQIGKAEANVDIKKNSPTTVPVNNLKTLQNLAFLEAQILTKSNIKQVDIYSTPADKTNEIDFTFSILSTPITWEGTAFSGEQVIDAKNGGITTKKINGTVSPDGNTVIGLTYAMEYDFGEIEHTHVKIVLQNIPLAYYGDNNQFLDKTILKGSDIKEYIVLLEYENNHYKDGKTYASTTFLSAILGNSSSLEFAFKESQD